MASSEAVASIKSYLKDILGSDSSVFSDDILESYIRKFSGRVDAVQCALESLIEEYYSSGSNDPMRRGGPSFVPESLPSSLEFFKLPFFKKVCTLYSMLTKILHCNVLDTVTKRDTIIFIWLILYCTLLNLEHSKPVTLIWSIMTFESQTNISWFEKVIPWETTLHWGPSEVDTSWQAVPGCQLGSEQRCGVRSAETRQLQLCEMLWPFSLQTQNTLLSTHQSSCDLEMVHHFITIPSSLSWLAPSSDWESCLVIGVSVATPPVTQLTTLCHLRVSWVSQEPRRPPGGHGGSGAGGPGGMDAKDGARHDSDTGDEEDIPDFF